MKRVVTSHVSLSDNKYIQCGWADEQPESSSDPDQEMQSTHSQPLDSHTSQEHQEVSSPAPRRAQLSDSSNLPSFESQASSNFQQEEALAILKENGDHHGLDAFTEAKNLFFDSSFEAIQMSSGQHSVN